MNETNFYCKPAPGERIAAALQIAPDPSAAIHGVVSDPEGAPIAAALALLFRAEEEDGKEVLIAQSTTDAEGHFAFWGLAGDALYRIKVFQQGAKVRELELRCDK